MKSAPHRAGADFIHSRMSAVGTGLGNPGCPDEDWLDQHSVRVTAQDEVDPWNLFGQLTVASMANMGQGNHQIDLIPKLGDLLAGLLDRLSPEVAAGGGGLHGRGDHWHHDSKNSHPEPFDLQLE